jgi:hypothetical protein
MGLWSGWVSLLLSSTYSEPFAAPLWLRLGLAAVTALLGGLSGRRWAIVAAVVVAHPAIWVNTLAIPILWAAYVARREGIRAIWSRLEPAQDLRSQ